MPLKVSVEDAEKEFIRVARGLAPERLIEIEGYGLVHLEIPRVFTSEGNRSEILSSELKTIFRKEILGEAK